MGGLGFGGGETAAGYYAEVLGAVLDHPGADEAAETTETADEDVVCCWGEECGLWFVDWDVLYFLKTGVVGDGC